MLCHGGERLALEADLAHSTMRGGDNPSDFSVVEASCGGEDCHSGSGASQPRPHPASHDQYPVYIRRGDRQHPLSRSAHSQICTRVLAFLPSRMSWWSHRWLCQRWRPLTLPRKVSLRSQKFGENCLDCHLEAEALPGSAYARLTGCAACHTPTAGLDITSGVTRAASPDDVDRAIPSATPATTAAITTCAR